MASGTISLGTSGKLTGQLVWSSTSNGSVANDSTVTIKIQGKKVNSTEATTGTWKGTAQIGNYIEEYSYYGSIGSSWVTVKTYTKTIEHQDSGYQDVYLFGSITGPSGTTLSGKTVGKGSSVVLDQIPRASVLGTISNFTLGNAINIPITKRSSSFTDNLTISLSGTTIKTINNITNGYDVSFTTSELNTIYSKLPSSTTGSFTFTLTTKSGSTTIGTSTKTATGTIPTSVRPTISAVVISEGNTSVVPDSWETFVKNKSKLKFVISASAGSGSSISSITTTIDGGTYSGSTITTNTIINAGNLSATIKVTDKRGRVITRTQNVTVVDYETPNITNITATRCDKDGNVSNNGTYAKVSLAARVYSLNGKNIPTYAIKYKKATEDEYTTYTFDSNDPTIDSYVILENIETGSSYNFMAVVTDYFNPDGINKSSLPLSSVFKTINFKVGGHGIGLGKVAEEEDTLDIGFKTKLTGGLTPIFLEADTDLNDIKTPNFYTGRNVSTYNYANCPLDSGTFSLEVVSCGEDGQVKQKYVYCHKTKAVVYERFYYGSTWGEWVKTSDYGGTLLWSGGYYMTAGHTAPLSEAISKQKNGICLVFSYFYDGTAQNYDFVTHFIPKKLVDIHEGVGHTFIMARSVFSCIGTKHLFIYDDKIVGFDNNNASGTANGITYQNNAWVLRYVIGV